MYEPNSFSTIPLLRAINIKVAGNQYKNRRECDEE